MNIVKKQQLPSPEEVRNMYPLSNEDKLVKEKNDKEVKDILSGKDDRFLLIIGPCSADNEESVIDYIKRLRGVQDKIDDVIKIVPRIYTNKPRTTGAGYKGMLHQPDPTGKPEMVKGLIAIRKMHMRALKETGFSCADEMLYPENHEYLDDLLTYVAVGARSVEDQEHRLTASGIDVPVGMKNPTSGDITVMLNAINAAQHSHTFIYRAWEVETKGNPYAHAILRGYVDENGEMQPNYHYETLNKLAGLYSEENFSNPAIVVDCNHCNSNKQYLEQIRIAKEIVHSLKLNEHIRKVVKGLMIESYIEDGCQKVGEGVYGKSITDPCLGWDKTEKLLLDLANDLRAIKKASK